MLVWLRTSASFSKKLARKFHQNFGLLRTQHKDAQVTVKKDGAKKGVVVDKENHHGTETATVRAEEVKTREMISNFQNSVIIAE